MFRPGTTAGHNRLAVTQRGQGHASVFVAFFWQARLSYAPALGVWPLWLFGLDSGFGLIVALRAAVLVHAVVPALLAVCGP